jgi:hypothetical protein
MKVDNWLYNHFQTLTPVQKEIQKQLMILKLKQQDTTLKTFEETIKVHFENVYEELQLEMDEEELKKIKKYHIHIF